MQTCMQSYPELFEEKRGKFVDDDEDKEDLTKGDGEKASETKESVKDDESPKSVSLDAADDKDSEKNDASPSSSGAVEEEVKLSDDVPASALSKEIEGVHITDAESSSSKSTSSSGDGDVKASSL